jgi:hypothetical protein
MGKKIEMWSTQFWLIAISVFVVATLFGYYVVPSIGVAVDPNASSKMIRYADSVYGVCGAESTQEQWIDLCVNGCGTEFNHNAQQLRLCTDKCVAKMSSDECKLLWA